jgi:Zn-dependent protease
MFDSRTPLHAEHSPVAEPVRSLLPPLEEPDDFPFEEPVKEARFQSAWRILKSTPDPRAKPNWWVFILIVALALMFLLQGGNFDPLHLGILVGVLLLHELGHLVAMKFFGYTDGKLFFIPFFTLAVLGKKHAAPAWHQALVILSGPLPGLLIALGWYAWAREDLDPWELHAIILLLCINLVNLLPFEPFDGGRLLNLILFSRNAWMESFMKLVTAASLGLVAFYQASPVLGVIALFTLLSLPYHFRKGLMIARLRHEGLRMPETVAALTPLQGRMLFAAAYDVLRKNQVADPIMAGIMRDLHDRILVPPPRFFPTLLLLVFYAGSMAIGLGTLTLMAYDIVALHNRQAQLEFQQEVLKRDLRRERGKARFLAGAAREKAQNRVKELQTRMRENQESLETTSEKLDKFHAVMPLPPGGNDPFGNARQKDEQDDQ